MSFSEQPQRFVDESVYGIWSVNTNSNKRQMMSENEIIVIIACIQKPGALENIEWNNSTNK